LANKIFAGVNDMSEYINTVYAGVNGVAQHCSKVYAGVSGKAEQIIPPPGYTYPIGTEVKITISGSTTNWTVVHNGNPDPTMYDSSFDDGIWLLMDTYTVRKMSYYSGVIYSDYSKSTIHSYLNTTFYALIPQNIRDIIKEVKLPYHPGAYGGSMDINATNKLSNGVSVKCFTIGGNEMGYSISNPPMVPPTAKTPSYTWEALSMYQMAIDGACLDYFQGMVGGDVNRKLKSESTNFYNYNEYWLRTPILKSTAANSQRAAVMGYYSHTYDVNGLNEMDFYLDIGSALVDGSLYVRPCIILPNTTKILNGTIIT
jgi:hypothetical protein